MTLRHQILILAALPIFALAAFSLALGFGQWQAREDAIETVDAIADAGVLSALVHRLQIERGQSAGFLASGGVNFAGELPQSREETDRAIEAVHPLPQPLAEHLAALADTRQAIDTLTLDGAGKLAGSAGRKVTLGIRPEDLIVQQDGVTGWPVTVSVSEQHGANSFLHCTLPDQTPILIHEPGQSHAKAGDLLHVLPRAGYWHLFDENELRIEA